MLQKRILTQYAQDNGFKDTSFFVDDGWTGVSFDRPAFMEMMEGVKSGSIKTIIVKDHSRLGRNRLIVGALLEEDFVQYGVRYIAVTDSIDTANGLDDLLPMRDLFNEWHVRETSKRSKRYLRLKSSAANGSAEKCHTATYRKISSSWWKMKRLP